MIASLLRPIALALIVSVTSTSFARSAGNGSIPIDPVQLHQNLLARRIGKGVKITQVDGTVIKGTLVSIDEGSFQVAPKNANQPLGIVDSQVSKLSKDGLSTGAKVASGVTVGVVIILGILILALRSDSKPLIAP